MKTKAVGELFAAQAWHAHMPHKSDLHNSSLHKSGSPKPEPGPSQPAPIQPAVWFRQMRLVKCDWSNAIDDADLSDRLTY